MSRTYELWDTTTKNLVGACATENDAPAFVCAYVAENGPQYPVSWVLLWDNDQDEFCRISERTTLLTCATATDIVGPESALSRVPGILPG